MRNEFLFTVFCIFSCGVWSAVGLYKLTHRPRMIEVIRNHHMPFPVFCFWVSVLIELGGVAMLIMQQYIWLVACVWMVFLIIATPIFHGRVVNQGTVDYAQLVHCGKNLSIAGGLLAMIMLDPSAPSWLRH